MHFEGLLVEDERDDGTRIIISFGIPPGREAAVGRDFEALLADGAEISLRNAEDEGGEGCTMLRRSGSRIESKVGGHGWQSDWKVIDTSAVLAAVADLAALNRGGHWSTQGKVTLTRNRG